MIIVSAGPMANFLLAVLVFWALFIHGIPALKPVLGEPDADTPAAEAGLRKGDELASVNGKQIKTFADLQMTLLESAVKGEKPVVQLANGEQRELDFSQVDSSNLEEGAKTLGFVPFSPDMAPVVGRLEPAGVAEKGGMRVGDRIESVNGQSIHTWQEFSSRVRSSPNRNIEVQVESSGSRRVLHLTPIEIEEGDTVIGRIGASPRFDPALFDALRTEQRHGPVKALEQAVIKTWETTVFSLKMLGRMVLGQVSWRNLSGPISIADYAGQTAQQGWLSFFGFLAVISIGLGVINLLPIPLLDGGHLMYYIFEVFRGRPVSERAMDIGSRIGMAVLGSLIFLALYNDILRVITK
jgi:regulator of sigma E protease